jgi:hypothetical protein
MVLVIHRTLPDLSGWQRTDPADLGVLGNDVLKRLNMVVDNRLGAVYLRPSRRATDTFRHPERLTVRALAVAAFVGVAVVSCCRMR